MSDKTSSSQLQNRLCCGHRCFISNAYGTSVITYFRKDTNRCAATLREEWESVRETILRMLSSVNKNGEEVLQALWAEIPLQLMEDHDKLSSLSAAHGEPYQNTNPHCISWRTLQHSRWTCPERSCSPQRAHIASGGKRVRNETEAGKMRG